MELDLSELKRVLSLLSFLALNHPIKIRVAKGEGRQVRDCLKQQRFLLPAIEPCPLAKLKWIPSNFPLLPLLAILRGYGGRWFVGLVQHANWLAVKAEEQVVHREYALPL